MTSSFFIVTLTSSKETILVNSQPFIVETTQEYMNLVE